MHRIQAFALLLVLLFAAFPCSAQMMEAAEYRGFLKRLDASTEEWRKQIAALNVEQLNVTFSRGKTIEGEKNVCLRNLTLVHDLIEKQITKDVLSDDVTLEESLADVSSMLSNIIDNLPENAQAVHWAWAIPSLDREIASYQTPLRKHALAYADMLQEKAAKCSR
jgi:hypothetical protein